MSEYSKTLAPLLGKPLLSKERERALFEKLEKDPSNAEIKEKIFFHNTRLVYNIANKVEGELGLEDKFFIGCLALVKAIDKFQLAKKVRFVTFAYRMILQAIIRGQRECVLVGGVIIPEHVRLAISKASKRERQRDSRLSAAELTNECGMSLATAELVFKLRNNRRLQIDEIDWDRYSALGVETDLLVEAPSRDWSGIFEDLTDQERLVVELYFFDQQPMGYISRQLKRSSTTVREIKERALEKLRLAMNKIEP